MTTRYVFVYLPGTTEAVPAGVLDIQSNPRNQEFAGAAFEYGRQYLGRNGAMSVDPVSLPLHGAQGREFRPINGLPMFGAIRDAAPDMWGRRVIENLLQRPGPLPEWMYLDHAGSDRAGALDVRTNVDSRAATSELPTHVDLEYLLDAAARIEAGQPVPAQLQHYFQGGPTMGGMRPKAVIRVDGRQFIAKFPSRTDRYDIPSIERATLELARAAGLDVPETRIIRMPDNRAVMLIERFDRVPRPDGDLARRHMVSALTMLGLAEQDSPDAEYADMADVISLRSPKARIEQDRRELFGRMIFNILVSNDDDHLRNHAFLWDDGGWALSPLYDVVPKPSASHERLLHLGVGEMGRRASADNALTHAGRFGLQEKEAKQIIERIHLVVREWRNVFEDSGVSPEDCHAIAGAFLHAKHNGVNKVLAS